MKICVYSSHQGSICWQKLLQIVDDNPDFSVENAFLVSDIEYRNVSGITARFFLRVKIYLVYPLKTIIQIILSGKKYDINLVITSPFFLPYVCAFFSVHTPFIILHNDIFPEALVQTRLISSGSIIEKALCSLRRYATKKAICNVFISDNHRQIVESKSTLAINSTVIPVGAISSLFSGKEIKLENNLSQTILYCGTLGLMHDYNTIVNYLSKYTLPDSISLEFKVSGAARIPFEKEIKYRFMNLIETNKILVSEPLSDDLWVKKMRSSSVGLILQARGGENIIFPSKFFSILLSGQAVLAVSSLESELAQIVLENDCGWVVEQGDISALHDVFKEIQIPEILIKKRTNAYNLGHSKYSIESLAGEWIHQINLASSSKILR